jgi:large subunit ribosomal protein L4
MPLVDVVNINNEKIEEIDLPEEIYDVELRQYLVHEVVTAQLHSRRAGTACTKTRGELAYSNRKPHRQKKTGRARAGTRRSPLWRGGGTVFGPKPRDFSWRPPARIRREALRIVLTAKRLEKELVILDDLTMDTIKTKIFKGFMDSLSLTNALVVIPNEDLFVELSSKNMTEFKVLRAAGLNCYDILKFDKLVLLKSSLEPIAERLAV